MVKSASLRLKADNWHILRDVGVLEELMGHWTLVILWPMLTKMQCNIAQSKLIFMLIKMPIYLAQVPKCLVIFAGWFTLQKYLQAKIRNIHLCWTAEPPSMAPKPPILDNIENWIGQHLVKMYITGCIWRRFWGSCSGLDPYIWGGLWFLT